MDITFGQLKEIAEVITQKDAIDYTISIGSLISSVAVILLSFYIFFKTPNQTARSKVYEKEVDLLYKAFDCFCLFSDTVGLYASNKYRKFKALGNVDSEPLDQSFPDKEKESSEDVYAAFKQYNMASNILQSIGALEPKKHADNYKIKTVELRELIIEFQENPEEKSISEYNKIANDIKKKQEMN
jgi:hypothetical protein